MQFVYKPEGAEPKRWDFVPEKMMSVECIEIERRTGWDFGEWLERFKRANMGAIHAYLYVMLKRELPGVKYDDVRFCLDDVAFEPSPDELSEARARLEEKRDGDGLDDGEAAMLAKLIKDGVEMPAPKD